MKPKPPKRPNPLGFSLPPRRVPGEPRSARPKPPPVTLDLGPDDEDDEEFFEESAPATPQRRGPKVSKPKSAPPRSDQGRRRPGPVKPPGRDSKRVAPAGPARPGPGRPAIGPKLERAAKDAGMRPIGPPPAGLAPRTPRPEVLHVADLELLARSTTEVAETVERAVFRERKRADRAIAAALSDRRDLAQADHRFINQAVMALFRWHGWVETLHLPRLEERLLLSWMLDAKSIHPVCRTWARRLDLDPGRLTALGGAPNWTARGEGWKRLNGGAPVNADPWRLFPQWFREHLPLPPGGASSKMKWLELLNALQGPQPLWVRAQGRESRLIWNELNEAGIKPWVHRTLVESAKLERDSDVHRLPPFQRGELEIQDLSSQIVGLVCDPDPGERWWDVCAGAGGKALHLAGLMKGKGLVVASDVHEKRLAEAVRRARRSPFRNLTTRPWDGKHVVGKAGRYDGVLVDAPCSAIGTWRRNPDARWLLERDAIPRLAATQLQILQTAAVGVRPGGILVYSVCTSTPMETKQVVASFLAARPEFCLDPFRDPLRGTDTDGTMQIWPQDADSDAMFIARMIRKSAPKPAAEPN
jgi:16S rRNA (cytosine967-C5)-methyltransferase